MILIKKEKINLLIKKTISLFLLLFCIHFFAFAQDITPKGWFHQHEVKLGEPVLYSLVLNHSSKLEFFFPDSTHDFKPFEYLDRTYFPTKTDSLGQSYDSVVYKLATFELGDIQRLSVPVFIKGDKNPRAIYPTMDSVHLVEIIEQLPDSVALFDDTTVAAVEKDINYPLLISSIVSIILGVLFIYLILGENIRVFFHIKKLKKRHLSHVLAFDKLIYDGGIKDIEPTIALWKDYAGSLMNVPLNSYTTKEISRVLPEEKTVIETLKQADRVIYAGEKSEGLNKKMIALKELSQKVFDQKIESIQQEKGQVLGLPPYFKSLPSEDLIYKILNFRLFCN